MKALKHQVDSSALYRNLLDRYGNRADVDIYMNSVKSGCLAEKALMYLFCEQNLIGEEMLIRMVFSLDLDIDYMTKVLSDNRRPISLQQPLLKIID